MFDPRRADQRPVVGRNRTMTRGGVDDLEIGQLRPRRVDEGLDPVVVRVPRGREVHKAGEAIHASSARIDACHGRGVSNPPIEGKVEPVIECRRNRHEMALDGIYRTRHTDVPAQGCGIRPQCDNYLIRLSRSSFALRRLVQGFQ